MVVACGLEVTPGIWCGYLIGLIGQWGDQARGTAVVLPTLRQMYPSRGPEDVEEAIDAAAGVLELLGWIGHQKADQFVAKGSLTKGFFRLAIASERMSDSGTAYNLAALAVDFGVLDASDVEQVARYALRLAQAADRAHQIAMCAARLAAAIAAAADTDPSRKLEAFDSVEVAIELLSRAEVQYRTDPATLLGQTAVNRDYLSKLQIPIISLLPADEQPAGLRELIKADRWPERVSMLSREEWGKNLNAILNAQFWEMEIDKARLELEPPPIAETAQFDWSDWTVDHPAYRRATPHSRSFLRERDFDSNLLVLTHEITHSMSLLGRLGLALNCLKVVETDNEHRLWSFHPSGNAEEITSLVEREGVAPLKDGDITSLFNAERGVEIRLKARILQDVWTPWLEGLAVFGESAADPALDPVAINAVSECLRSLIDLYPSSNQVDEDTIRAEFDQYAAEFEARCSAAISRRGPNRLRTYFDAPGGVYFPGYLAVRGIVSAWRNKHDQPITGTAAFNLLLHATRFGTASAMPDLSLRSDLFREAALTAMSNWVAQLARLDSKQIKEFLTPPQKNGPGRPFAWKGGQLTHLHDHKEAEREFMADVRMQLHQAFASLTRPEDASRVTDANEFSQIIIEQAAASSRAYFETSRFDEEISHYTDRVNRLTEIGAFMPIGRTAARYFLNLDLQLPVSMLATQMRTTEKNAESGQPGINGLWFPIPHDGAQKIAAAYRKSGKPRLEVTRIMDLSGPSSAAPQYMHLFVYRYDDWFDIRGTSPVGDGFLDKNPEEKERFRFLLKLKLYPPALILAERNIISRGAGVTRTRDWLSRTTEWEFQNEDFPVGDWADYVLQLTKDATSEEYRRNLQFRAAEALVSLIFGRPDLARQTVHDGFAIMSEEISWLREDLVQAFFKTAQNRRDDPSVNQIAQAAAKAGFAVFAEYEHGWDVTAAVLQ